MYQFTRNLNAKEMKLGDTIQYSLKSWKDDLF